MCLGDTFLQFNPVEDLYWQFTHSVQLLTIRFVVWERDGASVLHDKGLTVRYTGEVGQIQIQLLDGDFFALVANNEDGAFRDVVGDIVNLDLRRATIGSPDFPAIFVSFL